MKSKTYLNHLARTVGLCLSAAALSMPASAATATCSYQTYLFVKFVPSLTRPVIKESLNTTITRGGINYTNNQAYSLIRAYAENNWNNNMLPRAEIYAASDETVYVRTYINVSGGKNCTFYRGETLKEN
jgi:hypothetical protein